MGQNESSTLKAHNFFNIHPRDLGQIGGCSVEQGHSESRIQNAVNMPVTPKSRNLNAANSKRFTVYFT